MRKKLRELNNESSAKTGVDLPSSIGLWVKRFRSDWGFEPRNPVKPVASVPGTSQRVIDYERRVTLGQPIFVVGDAAGAKAPLAWQVPADGHRLSLRGDDRRGAIYHPMFTHRYLRWHRPSESKIGRHVMFIGLKPDPDFDRMAFAWSLLHGMHRCSVVNLFGTLQPNIIEQPDPIGDLNDVVIRYVAQEASIIVLAWDDDEELFDAMLVERAARLAKAIRRQRRDDMYVFGLHNGHPVGIDIALPLQRAPLVEGEGDLDEVDDDG